MTDNMQIQSITEPITTDAELPPGDFEEKL